MSAVPLSPSWGPSAHEFDGPVTALCCSEEATSGEKGVLVFGVGNQVYTSVRHTDAWDTRRHASLPCSAVITAVAHSREWIVAGAGDRLFVSRLLLDSSDSTSCGCRALPFGLCGRVISLKYQRGCFLAVTSRNALLAVAEGDLGDPSHDEGRLPAGAEVVHSVMGPAMALGLAADALLLADGTAVVFVGVYGGAVAVWSVASPLPCSSSDSSSVLAHGALHAHASRCSALFSIKAMLSERGELLVATCSDDRSAAVFAAPSLKGPWRCLVRESGPHVSCTRVFDVSLSLPFSPTVTEDEVTTPCERRLLLALASEDGSVVVRSLLFPSPDDQGRGETAPGPFTCFANHGIHGGRGAYRVALTSLCGTAAVVSGGFDGAVTVSCFPRGHVAADVTLPVALVTGVDGNVRRMKKGSVRCVFAEARSRTSYYCVEGEVFTGGCPSPGGASCAPAAPKRLSSWQGGEADGSGANTALLPSALVGVGERLAFVGTDGGHLIVCTRRGAEDGRSTVLPVWLPQKKCLAMKVVPDCVEDEVYWVLSSHASRSVLLTRVTVARAGAPVPSAAAVVVASLHGCDGLRVTSMELHLSPPRGDHVLAVTGDRGGCVAAFEASREALAAGGPCALPPQWARRVFHTPIHTASLDTVDRGGHTDAPFGPFLYVTSDDGAFAVVNRRVCLGPAAAHVLSPFPLRLPFEATRVLWFRPGWCVVQHGTSLLVYRSRPGDHVWARVAELADVRAPRLLHIECDAAASVVAVTHCSDGRSVETVFVGAAAEGGAPSRATVTLREGLCRGKDFNCTLALSGSEILLYGNEDSTLCLEPCERAGAAAPRRHARMVVKGPHTSNLLAMAEMPLPAASEAHGGRVRFVTVGGCATAAVWEWSEAHKLRVLSAGTFAGDRDAGAPATPRDVDTADERTARFMSVAALTATSVVVGSSDASLRVIHLREGGGGRDGVLFSLSEASSPLLPNPALPKPIVSLGVVASEPAGGRVTLLAGDTNGYVYVVSSVCSHADRAPRASLSVLRALKLEQSCVNVLTARAVTPSPSPPGRFLMAAMHDSGNIALLQLLQRHSESADAPFFEIGVLAVWPTGLTAGRGIAWTRATRTEDLFSLVAVNDERLMLYDVAPPDGLPQAGPLWRLRDWTRITVRCVSGLAAPLPKGLQERCANETPRTIAVVGQGIEYIALP